MAIALFATVPFAPNRRFPQFLSLLNNLAVSCHASNNNQPGRKARASRAAMSEEELCRELREFTISRGFPDDCVPSMKQLSDYGRKDLANIVRRRGYKAVRALLQNLPTSSNRQNSTNADSNDNAVQDRAASVRSTSIPSNNSLAGEKPLAYLNGAKYANNHAQINENYDSYTEPLQFELARFTSSGHSDMKEGEDHSCDASISWKARQQDDKKEIDRLKNLLNEKEIELSQLKRQIEDEKLALYDLQVKTEAEISKIQKTIVEKDFELQAAEESLSGLKEVHIDYVADGQIVEVTGSFNGWQHKIKMDLHPSVVHQDPPGVRKQLLWSTVLWLYPGVYEIKFIVDGHWRVDSEREITISGFVTNNVLRVDE